MRLIDKSAVVAEIERRIKALHSTLNERETAVKIELKDFLSFIDTLEVKEVDLEKEIQNHIKECLDVKFPTTDIELIKKDVAYTARKFFELGLKVQKL